MYAVFGLPASSAAGGEKKQTVDPAAFGKPRMIGRLGDDRLIECSGMDASLANDNLLWAINDGGNGAFLYALSTGGESLGRLAVNGAKNRDWEGLDTFFWKSLPVILIADFGDNRERHATHTLYVVEEPRLTGKRFKASASCGVLFTIVFSYPGERHDAECVFVDEKEEAVFVLTKRDKPPLLYSVPLAPASADHPATARKIAEVDGIPPPTEEDLLDQYGKYRSQPTGMDLSPDRRRAAVLTYKHAYLFPREPSQSWADALDTVPRKVLLPLPQLTGGFGQREAICFSPGGDRLFVTAEGRNAKIFVLEAE
jgi:hypothetical protein